jgi:hypothetical protein
LNEDERVDAIATAATDELFALIDDTIGRIVDIAQKTSGATNSRDVLISITSLALMFIKTFSERIVDGSTLVLADERRNRDKNDPQ